MRRHPIQRPALSGRSGGDDRGGKTRNTSADNDRIELYYAPSVGIMPLPSAEVDCRLFAIFATLVVERQSPGGLVRRFGA